MTDYCDIDMVFEYDCTASYYEGDVCLYNGNKITFLGYNKNNPTEKAPSPIGDFDPRFWDGEFLDSKVIEAST